MEKRAARLAPVVEEVLDSLGEGDRRVVFGHSMGGYIALMTALDAQDSGRPLDGLILYEPILLDLFDLEVGVTRRWGIDIGVTPAERKN